MDVPAVSARQSARSYREILLSSTPWLTALLFPLQTWAENYYERPSLEDIVVTFTMSLVIAALAVTASWMCLRESQRSSLVAAAFVMFFFAYGHAHELLFSAGLRHRWLFPIWCVAFLLVVWALARKLDLRAITLLNRLAAVTLSVLLATQGASLAWHLMTPLSLSAEVAYDDVPEKSDLPDIYFLVVDGYARADMLARYAHFDNGPFVRALESRGLIVRPSARSNYAQTMLSVPSTLSMDYVDPARPIAVVDENAVSKRLRAQGYAYRFLGSASQPFSRSPNADYEIRARCFPSVYIVAFAGTSILHVPLAKLGMSWDLYADHRHAIEFQLEQVANRPYDSRPIFTFAHIMLPHGPFYFGPNGPLPTSEVISPTHGVPFTPADLAAYVGQIEYLNSRLLEIVDDIDAQPAKVPPIILIQADHGGGFLGIPSDPSPEQIEERLSIFSAVRIPESMRPKFGPGITPVNQFRVILGHTLNRPMELLPDRSLYSSYEHPSRYFELPPQ